MIGTPVNLKRCTPLSFFALFHVKDVRKKPIGLVFKQHHFVVLAHVGEVGVKRITDGESARTHWVVRFDIDDTTELDKQSVEELGFQRPATK